MPETFQDTDFGIHTSENLLKVIDALPISILLLNQECTILLANQATSLLLGMDKTRLIGLVSGKAFGCIHDGETPEGCGFSPACSTCALRQTVQNTAAFKKTHPRVDVTMVLNGLGKRNLKISTLPIVLNGDEGVLLAMEDQTEERQHEQTRMEKERLSTVMKTVGAVCHEINQPLMIVNGLAEILMEDHPDDPVLSENLKQIREQVERLGNITKKLMTITRYRTKAYLTGEILDLDLASAPSPGEPG